MTVQQLNSLSADAAQEEFTRCCGASRWAAGMAARRPFDSIEDVYAASGTLWPTLTDADWREAFAHHPQIGDRDSLRARFADTRHWAAGEQAGAASAPNTILDALASGNAAYEAKFGHIFIVCATGKSAAEMLALLHARLPNPPAAELTMAAGEQRKITRLRLQKLLAAG